MHSGGDILVTQKEAGQDPFAVDVDVVTGSGTVSAAVAARVNFEIRVQKITVAYVTHANGKKITFQDNANTPVVVAVANDFTAAAGVDDCKVFDYGPRGTALTVDKQLDIVVDASGPAARIHIEGYRRLKSVISVGANTGSGTATSAS